MRWERGCTACGRSRTRYIRRAARAARSRRCPRLLSDTRPVTLQASPMLLRESCEICSLARRGEYVKLLSRNCRPRPSRRSSGRAALALRVAALAAALLLSGCGLSPAPLERANLLAEHGREPEAIGLLEQHLASHPGDVAERRQLIRLYGSVGRIDHAS